jgi:hypothetical protein
MGLLTQSRPQFLDWSLLMCIVVPFFTKPAKKIPVMIILLTGFFIASFYQIVGNVKLFQQFSFTTVDSAGPREIYDGILVKNAPLFPNNPYAYPPQMVEMYAEYSVVPRNAAERKHMGQKYMQKAISLIQANPADYVINRFQKMWTMWQKQNIFFYTEPGFEGHWKYTYAGNLLIIISSAIGLYLMFRSKKPAVRKILWLSLGLLGFMTLSICLTHAEPRLTIPVYPLFFLFSGVTIDTFIKSLTRRNNNG